MGARVAQPFQVAHPVAIVKALAFRLVALISLHISNHLTTEVDTDKQKRLETMYRGVGVHPVLQDKR
jgi:hypothetical protein